MGSLLFIGAVAVIAAGAMSYAVARRYNVGAALALPLLALLAMIAMRWQKEQLGAGDGLRLAGESLLFSAPILLGAFAGIAIAWFRRG